MTGAAARMSAGHLVGEETEPDAPPVDTGEAVGSPVSRLTITVGYGPSLFDDRPTRVVRPTATPRAVSRS